MRVDIQTKYEFRLQTVEASWNYWPQRWGISQEELCVCVPCQALPSVFMIPNDVFLLCKKQGSLDLV